MSRSKLSIEDRITNIIFLIKMQSKGFIKLIAALLAIACVYQFSFTFKTRSVEKKAARYAAQYPAEQQAAAEQHYLDSVQNLPVYNLGFRKFTYKECKGNELNLGLDLKGGMNVMMEVQVDGVIKALAGDSQNDPAFIAAIEEANNALKEGSSKDYVDVFVETYRRVSEGRPLAAIFVSPDRSDITLESSDSDVAKVLKADVEKAIGASFNVLRSRIDNFGVVQPNIMRLPNSHRILVELPGVKEPQRVRDLLQRTAQLEFWLTYDANELWRSLQETDALLSKEAAASVVETETVAETAEPAAQPAATNDLLSEIASAEPEVAETAHSGRYDRQRNPLFALLDPSYAGGAVMGAAYKSDMAAVTEYLSRPAVRQLFPADVRFMWSVKGDDKIDGRYYLYAIKAQGGKAPLDGSVVTEASEQYQQHGATAEVSMAMNSEGAQRWARLTGENIGKCVAIVLDGAVYSAPVVRTKIDKGISSISGDFTIQEAKDLANVLESGKVPAPAKIIQDTVVGPSLGQESINAGLLSFVIAFILVLLYMGLFYKTAGWLSDVALLTNVFLLMGILVSFGAVLTLPGIAGIVLTMGMAVDANVIIYERIKEELRGGKGLSLAIKDGFSKAYSAIIDGNLTTIITGIVLLIFGNGPVRGFATTLIIGIITSFVSAVFITRLLIDWIAAKWGNVSFSRKWSEGFLNNTHIDFLNKRKISYIIAAAVIIVSCVSFVAQGLNLGAEFTGGRAYVIRFDKPVLAEDVRTNLHGAFSGLDADASKTSYEVKQYGNERQMRIVTQYKYDDTSDTATAEVEEIIYNALKPLYSYDISFENFSNTQNDENGIVTADKIGPSIASDMTWNAIYSVLFSLTAIGLYITFRFKRWQSASGATMALAVNALFIIGVFSLFYKIMPFNLEVNQAFIAAILTIIGYAINDTVVVFDRIREYLGLYPKRNLKENVNNAINSTLSRTINTSGTTLVTLLAIFFFGGESIRAFIFALIIGVVVGTIATIFIATPVAYDLMSKRAKIDKE